MGGFWSCSPPNLIATLARLLLRHRAEINAVLFDGGVLSLKRGHGEHPAGEMRSPGADVERAHPALVGRVGGASPGAWRHCRGGPGDGPVADPDRSRPAGTAVGRPPGRVRRPGGGRKRRVDTDVTLLSDLNALVEPVTAGAPDDSPLRWTSKSTRKLAVELQALGHSVSPRLVSGLLHELGYTLQANRKTREGTQHPDRDAQFHYLNDQVRRAQAQGQPVICQGTPRFAQLGDTQIRAPRMVGVGGTGSVSLPPEVRRGTGRGGLQCTPGRSPRSHEGPLFEEAWR